MFFVHNSYMLHPPPLFHKWFGDAAPIYCKALKKLLIKALAGQQISVVKELKYGFRHPLENMIQDLSDEHAVRHSTKTRETARVKSILLQGLIWERQSTTPQEGACPRTWVVDHTARRKKATLEIGWMITVTEAYGIVKEMGGRWLLWLSYTP